MRERAKGWLSINYGYFTQFSTQFSYTTKFCWRAAVAEYKNVHIITIIAPILKYLLEEDCCLANMNKGDLSVCWVVLRMSDGLLTGYQLGYIVTYPSDLKITKRIGLFFS
jgi:hypothetical protein